MSHDLYIATHEDLIVEALDGNCELTYAEAETITEPLIHDRMAANMADATDRAIDAAFDRADAALEAQVAPVLETLSSIERQLGIST